VKIHVNCYAPDCLVGMPMHPEAFRPSSKLGWTMLQNFNVTSKAPFEAQIRKQDKLHETG